MRRRDISFTCGSLRLQGRCYFPGDGGALPAVVLCHPHPLYGGSMDNNVILAVASALADKSIIALMFNFRGVGGSQGSYSGGIGEQEDVTAAIGWLDSQPEVDGNRVGLVGYSFGATVALPVACADERVKAVALISPPLEAAQIPLLKGCTKPKLIICGSQDFIVPAEQAQHMGSQAAEPKLFELVPGADHFWWAQEATLADKVTAFFAGTL